MTVAIPFKDDGLLRKRFQRRLFYWFAGAGVAISFTLLSQRSDPLLQQFNAPVAIGSSPDNVDQTLYETAHPLAMLAAVPQEQQIAAVALRAADHELNQDFASAIRESAKGSAAGSPDVLAAKQTIAKLRTRIKEDQAQVDLIQGQSESEPTEDTSEQLRLAQAQLALDNDELENAQDDLNRLGGDQRARLQQAFDQHRLNGTQAIARDVSPQNGDVESANALSSVRGRTAAYFSLKDREKRLQSATAQVNRAAADITSKVFSKTAIRDHLDNAPTGSESRADKLARMGSLAEVEKETEELQRRERDLTQLRAAYADWTALLERQRHSLRVALLTNGISITMSILGGLVLVSVIQYAVAAAEQRRQRHLDHIRVLATLVVELCVGARLFVVLFGVPGNISTAIGLVTAALTVALRDYVVSFVGWFALMGKRGIRSGDWVEIDGTQGEVAEITVLHTYLLETGNWTTDGHWTGRQVVFLNKYAVEQKYFNSSTEEQWLWDELAIPVPASRAVSQDLLDKVSADIRQATAVDTDKAMRSWRLFVEAHKLTERTETPAVVLRTCASGYEIRARYVTKAPERFQTGVTIRRMIVEQIQRATTS